MFKQKLRNNFWDIVFFLLLLVLTVLICNLIVNMQRKGEDRQIIVGGIFIGTVEDDGWNQSHYEGMKSACEDLGHALEIEENVEETLSDTEKAVQKLVEKGCRVIFLTSDGFGHNIYKVVKSYPDVSFYTISPETKPANMTNYYGRMYQVRYFAGILAGMMTKTNVLGFVAAKSNAQVARDINAYLLGARLVNPDAIVKVHLTGGWSEAEAEREAALKLIDEENADILTYHSSTDEVIKVAEERSVYSIGYGRLSKRYSDSFLAGVVFHWGTLYKAMLQDYQRGSVRTTDYYWWGVSDGAVEIEGFSPMVDTDAYTRIKEVRESFASGKDVFLGKIVRNDGKVMCRDNERMSDEALLLDMNWFVEGVVVDDE
ncbi:MAG: BMP family ABC transporter substrate-binding protein [Lachnospiraceae bacterium]|nr:BMP family ABC transporter substrate-binding protein [Lachnospiraceae bacterium]